MNLPLDQLRAIAASHPHPLLFATVSGAHLYGFPSPDSDFDLRGAHILRLEAFGGLDEPEETHELMDHRNGMELDLVTHDVRKFFRMLLKPNGYALEQVLSPLVVTAMPEHTELCAIARRGITRHCGHHYAGFARGQKKLFDKEQPRRVKPLLYIYRVLLTGIHLMRSGELNANLIELNEVFRLPYVPELVERKIGGEHTELGEADLAFHDAEFERLYNELEAAREASSLPAESRTRGERDSLLRRLR